MCYYMKRNIKKAVQDTYRDEYCGIYINWNMPPRRWDNMTKIHWCYTRILWRNKKLYALTSSITLLLVVVDFAWKRTRQYGPQVKQKTGISTSRQFLTQLYLAIRYFITPSEYYLYNLYDPVNYHLASLYVLDHEIIQLLEFLNTSNGLSASNGLKVFDDKRFFFKECKRLGLSTIPIIAEFEDGKIMTWLDDTYKEFPKLDLVIKPANGRCGQEVKFFVYEEPNRYRSEGGILLTKEELKDYILECVRKKPYRNKPYILQERVFNHPDISGLSRGDGLCTCRVVTCRAPNGLPEYLLSIFKIPTGKCYTDNFATGGIIVPVDKTSGILGKGISKNFPVDRIDRHPDTGRKIEGVQIPYWQQIIQLCLQAHEAFIDFASVGWDVAVTRDGPVLVEANWDWGVRSMQSAHNKPLGRTRFAEIYILHLKHQRLLNSISGYDFWTPE